MKRIIIFLLCVNILINLLEAQDQPAKWDSTYRPSTYYRLVDQFNSFKHTKKDIIFLGNSITFGIDWCELLELPKARNRGISGDRTFGVLERLQEVIEGKPAKVFILIGINDILHNVPDSIVILNYKNIISRIIKGSPNSKIYIQSILPVNESFPKYKSIIQKSDRIITVNKALKQLAKDYKVTYIDLYASFTDSNGQLKSKYTYDGLHLTLAGYQQWKGILFQGRYLR